MSGAVKWIKISVGMFDDEKIQLIDSLPDSDSILVIWMRLLTLAAKVNAGGEVYLAEDIPYTEEMLSTIFHRKVNTVRLALGTFVKFGMVEISDSKKIIIKNWAKHQNIDGLEKIREGNRLRQQKARHRSKNGSSLVNGMVHDPGVTRDITLPSRDITQQNKKESGNVTRHVPLEEEIEEDLPPTVPQGGPASAEFVITEEAEAKRWICKLILKGKDPNRPWSYDAQSGLVRQLPIPMREIQLVGRFHAIPPDDNVLELRTRRQSEGTLLPNWSDEVTKAEAFLEKIGAGGFNGTTPKKEPPLWRQFFRWKYQPNCVLPPAFAELDTHLKSEWAREHEPFDKSPEWWHPTAKEIFPNSDNLPASILDMPPTSRAKVLKKLSLTSAA